MISESEILGILLYGLGVRKTQKSLYKTSTRNVYYVQKKTLCVLVLYKDFCIFLTHKPYNKIPKNPDSKIITFYTNTTPTFADFAKKAGALRQV